MVCGCSSRMFMHLSCFCGMKRSVPAAEDEIQNDRGWNICLREAWETCVHESLQAVIECQTCT